MIELFPRNQKGEAKEEAKQPEQLLLDLESFEEAEKNQILERSRRLGSILKKFRGKIPSKAFLLQALFATYLATTEVAHIETHDDMARLNYSQKRISSLYRHSEEGKRVPLDEMRDFINKQEVDEVGMYMYTLGKLKRAKYDIAIDQKILITTNFDYYFPNENMPAKQSYLQQEAQEAIQKKKEEDLVENSTLEDWTAQVTHKYVDDPSSLYKHEELVDEKIIPKEKVSVYPLRVRMETVNPEHTAIWAADYSEPKNPVFFFRVIKDGDEIGYTVALKELQESLKTRSKTVTNESFYKSIPEKFSTGKLITLDDEASITPGRREQIKKFFDYWEKVEIEANGLVDLAFSKITLSNKQLGKTSVVQEKNLSIHVKGSLAVTLSVKLEHQPVPSGWSEDKKYIGDYKIEKEKDGYGNEIELATSTYTEEGGKTVAITKNYTIRMPGMGISDGSPALIDSKLLGEEGLPFLNRSLDQNFVIRRNGFEFYHPFKPEVIKTYSEEIINSITQGAQAAERLLGPANKSFIKSVIILSTDYENAFFIDSEESSISFTEDIINKNPPAHLINIAQHEAFHAIDHKYGISEKLEELHLKLSWGEFFERLDEESFFKSSIKGVRGGHSRENPAEMFASFVVSLTHPDWEKKIIIENDTVFQEQYLSIMKALLQIFNEIPELKEAPIKNLLVEKISYLEKMRSYK